MDGTTTKVRTVEIKLPQIMATAMGRRDSDPGPKENARGMAPATVEKVVIRMGRKRLGHASFRASKLDNPSERL